MKAAAELRVLLDVLAVRAQVQWLLATQPLDRCLATLGIRGSAEPTAAQVERIGRWTTRLLRNRRFPPNTCLQRALTRFALLSRAGADVEFVLGLGSDGLQGHAWVVLDGTPWMERHVGDLVPTFRHSSQLPHA